jgi:hypothetical protein
MGTQNKSQANVFSVDPRITLKIEPALAVALGRLILDTKTDNTALLAIGHQLRSLANATVPRRPENDL